MLALRRGALFSCSAIFYPLFFTYNLNVNQNFNLILFYPIFQQCKLVYLKYIIFKLKLNYNWIRLPVIPLAVLFYNFFCVFGHLSTSAILFTRCPQKNWRINQIRTRGAWTRPPGRCGTRVNSRPRRPPTKMLMWKGMPEIEKTQKLKLR